MPPCIHRGDPVRLAGYLHIPGNWRMPPRRRILHRPAASGKLPRAVFDCALSGPFDNLFLIRLSAIRTLCEGIIAVISASSVWYIWFFWIIACTIREREEKKCDKCVKYVEKKRNRQQFKWRENRRGSCSYIFAKRAESAYFGRNGSFCKRRKRDLNPCAGATDLLVFEARPFSHLGIPPKISTTALYTKNCILCSGWRKFFVPFLQPL